MMSIIQGTLGSGKSAVALLTGIEHLRSGGVFCCNFNLVDDWALRLARSELRCRLGFVDPVSVAEDYYNRCFRIGKPESLYSLAEKIPDIVKGWAKKQREGQALCVLDEAQLYFNSRDWAQNKDFMKFFSQSRKLKFDVLLVAHHIDMIDKQIRNFIEIEARFRNLNKMRSPIPFIPMPLSPFTAFLVIRNYAGRGPGSGMKHSTSLYRLNKGIAGLYDSFEVFGFDSLPDEYCPQGSPPTKKQARKKAKKKFPPGRVCDYHETVVPEGA